MRRRMVIPVEGVLRKPIGGQVSEDGLALYRAMRSEYGVILVSTDMNKDHVLDFLEKEGITGYDDVLFYQYMWINASEGFWTNVIRMAKLKGAVLAGVVVNDPQSAMEVIESHVPVLMYSQPAYALPEWLPGRSRGAESWSVLAERVEHDALARRDDKRMEEGTE